MTRTPRRLQRDERGSGTVSALAGVTVVLAFVLLAAQVMVHLYATAVVSAAAYEAGRLASADGSVTPAAAAAHGRAVLGRYAEHLRGFDVTVGADVVEVHVSARSPALLPAAFGHITGLGEIDRRVILRRERMRCDGCAPR